MKKAFELLPKSSNNKTAKKFDFTPAINNPSFNDESTLLRLDTSPEENHDPVVVN